MNEAGRELPAVSGAAAPPAIVPAVALVVTALVQVTAASSTRCPPSSARHQQDRFDPAMGGYVVGADLAAQVAGTVVFLGYGRRQRWSAIQTRPSC